MSARRTSFHFPREAVAQLNAIRARTHLQEGADVIRAALASYDALLDATASHAKIVVRSSDGKEWPYSPYQPFTYPGLEKLPPASNGACNDKKIPKNFFFSGEAVEKLESIKARSYVQTNADAIRVALTAYNELISINAVGDDIVVRGQSGEEQLFNPHNPVRRPAQARVATPLPCPAYD